MGDRFIYQNREGVREQRVPISLRLFAKVPESRGLMASLESVLSHAIKKKLSVLESKKITLNILI